MAQQAIQRKNNKRPTMERNTSLRIVDSKRDTYPVAHRKHKYSSPLPTIRRMMRIMDVIGYLAFVITFLFEGFIMAIVIGNVGQIPAIDLFFLILLGLGVGIVSLTVSYTLKMIRMVVESEIISLRKLLHK